MGDNADTTGRKQHVSRPTSTRSSTCSEQNERPKRIATIVPLSNESNSERNAHAPSNSSTPLDPTNRFRFISVLGKGTFGTVWKALDRNSGNIVAVKAVAVTGLSTAIPPSVATEVEIMRKLNHPNIIQFKEVIAHGTEVQIVMEYVDGMPLNTFLSEMGTRMNDDLRFNLFQQMLCAVCALHQQNICHRDIKLENIMVTATKQIKLIDFGLSKQSLEPSTPCGSIHYAAPEIDVAREKAYNGQKADMWSIGVCLYALLFGKLPFNAPVNNMVRYEVRCSSIQLPTYLPTEMKSLLFSLLERNPEARLTCEAVINHPYWASAHKPQLSAPHRDNQDAEMGPMLVQMFDC